MNPLAVFWLGYTTALVVTGAVWALLRWFPWRLA
jgi:hypothetical protein